MNGLFRHTFDLDSDGRLDIIEQAPEPAIIATTPEQEEIDEGEETDDDDY